jgi:hypothetical protein
MLLGIKLVPPTPASFDSRDQGSQCAYPKVWLVDNNVPTAPGKSFSPGESSIIGQLPKSAEQMGGNDIAAQFEP